VSVLVVVNHVMPIFAIHVRAHDVEELFLMKPAITACMEMESQLYFPFVYEQEPSYNQNYDGNYYSHDLPSFPCCDYCGGSHENFQCQPDNQNVDFSGSDQLQNPQYPNIHPPNDEFEAYTNVNDAIMNDLQFKLDNFQKNQQDFQEKFEQMQDDFQNQMWNFMQNFHDGLLIPPPGEEKEHEATTDTKLPSTEEIQPLPKMEDTILELVKICQENEFLCTHNDVDDLIESALDSKLLSINSKSQRLDKKEQEVKNVAEQPAEHGTQPKNLLSMGYEHLSITPETESDEVTESNAENLLPIPNKCEVTLEDKGECDLPIYENILVCDNSDTFSDSKIDDDISVYDDDFEDIEDEEINLEEISQVQDVVLSEKLFSINRLIANIESLKDNPTPICVFNSSTLTPIFEESDNSLSLPEFETFYNHTEETRSDNTTTHPTDSLPEYDSFRFEIEPDQEELFNVVMNDISDDPSISRPPPEPPDVEFNAEFEEEISVVINEFDVSDYENDDYCSFMFVIRFFLPYLIFPKEFSFLSAESEDTIFDPGISD
nr:hypothetical protein [Tanacetum cinerariifolium]